MNGVVVTITIIWELLESFLQLNQPENLCKAFAECGWVTCYCKAIVSVSVVYTVNSNQIGVQEILMGFEVGHFSNILAAFFWSWNLSLVCVIAIAAVITCKG